MSPFQWLKLRGFKNDIFEKDCFLNSDLKTGIINYQLATLPNFAKFYPQTIEMQSFKVECFSMKMLKFQHDDVLSMTSVDISEFCLACGIGLS